MTEIFFLDDSDDFNAGSLNDQDYEPELKTRTGGERGRKKKRKQDTTDTKRRRATAEQRLRLLTLVEENPSLTLESKTTDDPSDVIHQWSEISRTLNALAGPTKSGQQWRRLWNDMVVYLKRKIFSHTSQGDLTEYERRVCEIYKDCDDFPKLKVSETSSGPVIIVGLGRTEVGLHSPSRSPSPPPLPKSEHWILLEYPMEGGRLNPLVVLSSSGAATGDIRGTSDFKRQLKRRCRDNEASHLDKTQVNRLEVLALNSEILDSQVMVNSEVKNISAEMKRIADVLEKCFELYCQNILPPEL